MRRRGFALLVSCSYALVLSVGCGGSDDATFGDQDAGVGGSGAATGGTGGGTGGVGGDAGSGGSTGGAAGSTGGSAGSTGGSAGSTGGAAGSTGGSAGSTGGSAGSTGGSAGSTGGSAGSTGGSAGTGGGGPCKDNGACTSTEYCAKPSCGATNGTCQLRPTSCPPAESPSCGCDGLTYWNDCLRQQHGVAASSQGVCSGVTAKVCGGFAGLECPSAAASCAYLLESKLGCSLSDPLGKCWVLPADCPQIVIGGNLRACAGSNACVDRCKAIKAQSSYYVDSTCPQ